MNEDVKELHSVELVNIETGKVVMKLNSWNPKESDTLWYAKENVGLDDIDKLNALFARELSPIRIDLTFDYEYGHVLIVQRLKIVKNYSTSKAEIEFQDIKKFDLEDVDEARKLALRLHEKEKGSWL